MHDTVRCADLVAAAAREHEAGRIVVGRPLNMNGTAGDRVSKAEAFAALLRERIDVEVVLWDERLTSVDANRIFVQRREEAEKAEASGGRGRRVPDPRKLSGFCLARLILSALFVFWAAGLSQRARGYLRIRVCRRRAFFMISVSMCGASQEASAAVIVPAMTAGQKAPQSIRPPFA